MNRIIAAEMADVRENTYDLVIKNGRVIDGTGSPAYLADVAVKDGKIVRVGRGIEGGEQEIDASGLVVTPGFIDSHSHSDSAILTYPDQVEKIEQGITTSIGGQCGSSPAPLDRDTDMESQERIGAYGRKVDVLRTMGSFLETAKGVSQGSNIAVLVGQRAIRRAVMGMENRAPSKEELEKMKALLREGMEHGAIGISFGLIYPPGCYAKTEELIELAKVVGEYHGLVVAHIRDESGTLVQAVEEFISVIRASGTRGVISHHKSSMKENWGKVKHTLRMIDEANAEGVEVYCDVYPYSASSTSVSATFIPKELHAGGNEGLMKLLSDPEARERIKADQLSRRGNDGLGWVQITRCTGYPQYEGLRVPEIARIHGKDVYDTIFDLIEKSNNACNASYFTMCEEDIETVLAHPRAMIGTDAGVAGANKVYHPRLRGTFPRVLGRYVRERGVTTLPEMIRKMTSMPAAVYGLKSKGLLWEDFDADICIFDPDRIIDRAEYTDCGKRAEGLNYVILGGEIVVEDAVYSGKRNGGVILR
ncbi:MAG: D-aminoacylase [Lachnospiraceae bacterium]|nr:D-aminoacylase [Lachnospiraceae bacterium]